MSRIRTLSNFVAIFFLHFSAAASDVPPLAESQAWFTAARGWLDASTENPPTNAEIQAFSALPPAAHAMPFSAVAVVLRLDGRPVGDSCKQGPLSSAVRDALAAALLVAKQDRRIAALPAELRAKLGERLTLELEFGGDAKPLVGERLDLLATQIDPGREGFAIRNGERWIFALPSQLQMRNQVSHLNFIALSMRRDVGLDPAASKDLKLPQGAAAYRIRTRRLAQATPNAHPFESIRGSMLVPLESITRESLREMSRSIARHMRQRWPAVEGLPAETAASLRALGPRSIYQPTTGEWPQPLSPPAEQALAAFAMARLSEAEWLSTEERVQAATFACETIDALRVIAAGESDPKSDASAMSCIMLAAEILMRQQPCCLQPNTREWVRNIREALLAWAQQCEAPTATQAAMALAALGSEKNARLLEIAWSPTNPERTILTTPWLIDRNISEAANAWKLALTPLVSTQFDATQDASMAPDLDGGWAGGSALSRPTALSARAAFSLASVIRRPDLLQAADREHAVKCLRKAMRFLMQLQADAYASYAFRDPSKALGGIRTAPWDSDQSIAAASYALLAAMQASEALPDTPVKREH